MAPRIAKELSATEVKRLTWGVVKSADKAKKRNVGDPCTAYHAVGGVSGLLLQCRPPQVESSEGAKSWVLRTTVGEKRRDIGLGGYPDVTLAQAREKAREIKDKIRQGIDPIDEKKALRSSLIKSQSKAITFSQVADEYLNKKSREYKSDKQIQNLKGWLDKYILPFLGKLLPDDIELAHVEQMLKPIWETKNHTANRVRTHTEAILDLARVKGLRTGDNPARLKGNLDHVLIASKKIHGQKNQPALPVNQMPLFWHKLTKLKSVAAATLKFQILTASRSGAVRLMTWSEVDLDQALWTLPGNRVRGKVSKNHIVPLCDEAVKIIKSMPHVGDYVFTTSGDKGISDTSIKNVILSLHEKQKKADEVGFIDPNHDDRIVTPHGFRSTFKVWATEFTAYSDEASELALSHVNSDKTRTAYQRSQLIDIRRRMMDDWQEYCLHGKTDYTSNNVVQMKDSSN